MESIVRIGSVELTEQEAYELYERKIYIVAYSRIYQLHYSQAQKRVYGQEIFYQKGLARRGRFHKLTGRDVNHLVGYQLVIE